MARKGLSLKKLVAGPGMVWRDLKRTIRGLVTFAQYFTTQERIEVGLGWLAADAGDVVIGHPSRYVVRIANAGDKTWTGKLVIDIIPIEASDPLEGGPASFAKQLMVAPCRAVTLEIQYDWLTQATFVVDGRASPPDEFHKGGTAKPGQLWAVHARLRDMTGERLDQLTIYQRMKR
jgi:hypothetical protein